MFGSVLIANRGEIAVRVARTAKALGIRVLAVYSKADADALHVREADEVVLIGGPTVQESYLDMDAVLRAAQATGAQAVHPGYGLLSENAAFAQRVQDAGMVWVGPSPEIIDSMGDKTRARQIMARADVPVARGTATPPRDVAEAMATSAQIGFPLMLKASAGGGGIGMAAIESPEQLRAAFGGAQERARRMFGSSDVLLEQMIRPARHIEVQIVGFNDGTVIALGERDCSVQRRFQKVIEEAPATGLPDATRRQMLAAATAAGQAIDYRGAGTVEFLYDPASDEFVFLEMNTRLQVEHPVTELVTGLDLVALQFQIAAGEDTPIPSPPVTGHALEFRIYAEDPVRLLPSPGVIETWAVPDEPWIRLDAGYGPGTEVSRYYDPLIAKLCVHGADRREALERARHALAQVEIGPVTTNVPLLRHLTASAAFTDGSYDTQILERYDRTALAGATRRSTRPAP